MIDKIHALMYNYDRSGSCRGERVLTCGNSTQFDRIRVFEEQSRGICAREQIPRG